MAVSMWRFGHERFELRFKLFGAFGPRVMKHEFKPAIQRGNGGPSAKLPERTHVAAKGHGLLILVGYAQREGVTLQG